MYPLASCTSSVVILAAAPQALVEITQLLPDIDLEISTVAQQPAATEATEITASEPAVVSSRERRVVRDDIDPELMEIFIEETQELMPEIGGELRTWRAHPQDPEAPQPGGEVVVHRSAPGH